MGNEFFLHKLCKPHETTLAAPLAMPLHLYALPHIKKMLDEATPFAGCIGRAASAVGCGESYQLLLLEQASPKFIIKRLSEFDKFTGSVTANNGWYVVLE